MYIVGTSKELVASGKIIPLYDRARYVVELDEYGEVKGDLFYREYENKKKRKSECAITDEEQMKINIERYNRKLMSLVSKYKNDDEEG